MSLLRGCLFALLLLVGGVALFPQSALGQEEPGTLSLSAYEDQLRQALADLAAGESLSSVKRDLSGIEEVRLADGRLLSVESPLLGVGETGAAEVRLRGLLAQLEASANDRSDERLAQLDQTIRRLALDRPTLWQRITSWLENLLNSLLPEESLGLGTGAVAATSRVITWVIIALAVLGAVALLGYWLRSFLGGILSNRAFSSSGEGAEALPRTAQEARTQAQSYASTGNYREAVRRLYLSALLHLDENGLIHFEREQTNREVLAQVAQKEPVAQHLAPVVDTFDRVWYGVREPDEATFTAYSQEIDSLMATTGDAPVQSVQPVQPVQSKEKEAKTV